MAVSRERGRAICICNTWQVPRRKCMHIPLIILSFLIINKKEHRGARYWSGTHPYASTISWKEDVNLFVRKYVGGASFVCRTWKIAPTCEFESKAARCNASWIWNNQFEERNWITYLTFVFFFRQLSDLYVIIQNLLIQIGHQKGHIIVCRL